MPKKVRLFLKRSSKVEVQTAKKAIVIPFRATTVLFLFIMILVSIFLFLRSDLLQINQIEVAGKLATCATVDGIKLTSQSLGASIIFFDTKTAQDRILEKFYCLSAVKMVKNYPAILEIETFERRPIAVAVQIETEPPLAVATASATTIASPLASPSAFFALDKQGVIFEKLATTSAFPKVYFASELELSGKISQNEILWLLDFLTAAENFNLNFDEFIKTQEGLLVGKTKKDGVQLIMSAATDPAKTASSLQAILRQAKIEGANFKILDLRFDKPIIK